MEGELNKSISVLKQGGTFLYPTDTVWGLGCDATNEDAVKSIYKIKQRSEGKSLIILVDSFEMLCSYVDYASRVIASVLGDSKKPTTVIYKNPINLASNLISSDNTVAIRIVKDAFCQELIRQFGKPIVSTSANISGSPTPQHFDAIQTPILESVDYVVNLNREKKRGEPSRIIRLKDDGSYTVIRY